MRQITDMVGYYLQDKQPTFHISQAMMGKYWGKLCECVFISVASSCALSGLMTGNLLSPMKPWWMLSCWCSQLFKQWMPLIPPLPVFLTALAAQGHVSLYQLLHVFSYSIIIPFFFHSIKIKIMYFSIRLYWCELPTCLLLYILSLFH